MQSDDKFQEHLLGALGELRKLTTLCGCPQCELRTAITDVAQAYVQRRGLSPEEMGNLLSAHTRVLLASKGSHGDGERDGTKAEAAMGMALASLALDNGGALEILCRDLETVKFSVNWSRFDDESILTFHAEEVPSDPTSTASVQ